MWKIQKKFLERLNALRGERSVVGFARDCGIPQQTMSAYCKGERVPGAEALLQIATTNVVSVDWLLGFTDSRTGTAAPATDAATLAKIAALEAEIAAIRAEKDAEIARLNGVIEGLRLAFTTTGKGK